MSEPRFTSGEAIPFRHTAREIPIFDNGRQVFACASEGSALSAQMILNALESKLERAIRGLEEIAKPSNFHRPSRTALHYQGMARQLLKDLQEGNFTEIQ